MSKKFWSLKVKKKDVEGLILFVAVFAIFFAGVFTGVVVNATVLFVESAVSRLSNSESLMFLLLGLFAFYEFWGKRFLRRAFYSV